LAVRQGQRADVAKQRLDEQTQQVHHVLARIAIDCPAVARMYGISGLSRSSCTDLTLPGAEIKLALAMTPKPRGADAAHLGAHARAVCVAAHTGLRLQAQRAADMFTQGALSDMDEGGTPHSADDSAAIPSLDASKVSKLFTWCWDESQQKVQRFRRQRIHRNRDAGDTSQQVVVQCGKLAVYKQKVGDENMSKTTEPIITRPQRLEHTKTNIIVEAITRTTIPWIYISS
jgi:hypothetical protein